MRRTDGRSAALRLVTGAVVIGSASFAAARVGPGSTSELRALVADQWWGPVLFGVVVVVMVVLAVPGTIGTAAAGVLYGPVLGSIIALVSASIGATIAFGLGRRFGRSAFVTLIGSRGATVDARVAVSGWRGLLLLRLLPVVPFNALNYAAGLSSLSTRDYLLGTVLGIVPGTVAVTMLSSSAQDPRSPAFLWSAAAVVSLSVVVTLVRRRSRRLAPD